MNFIESVLYGLISGFTEFLPLSSYAHQQMLLHLFGESFRDPARDLFVHFGLLFALRVSCRSMFEHFSRNSGAKGPRAARSAQAYSDAKLVKLATLPMLVIFFALRYIFSSTVNLLIVAVFMIVNGFILFIPERIASGNKTASAMSPLDSILVGASGALGAIPGFSRLGCAVSVAMMRGADRQHALRWTLLLSVPALWALIAVDLVGIFSGNGVSTWGNFFQYAFSGLSAFAASVYGIKLARFLSVKQGYGLFSYYSWGAALLSFFLYLTVV